MFRILRKSLEKRDYLLIGILTIMVLVSSFLSIWPITLIKRMVDIAFSRKLSDANSIIKAGLFYLLAHVLTALLSGLSSYITEFLQYKTGYRLQSDIYDKLLTMRIVSPKDSVGVVNKIVKDTDYIIHNLFRPYVDILISLSTFAFGLYFMLRISVKLTLIVLPLGLIMTIISRFIQDKSEKNAREKRELSEKLWKTFMEGVRGIIPIRIHHIEKEYLQQVKSDGRNYKEVGLKQSLINAVSYFSASSLYMVTIGVILIGASIFVLKGDISVGSLTAIAMYNHMLVDPLLRILDIQQNVIKLKVSSNRINDLFDDDDIRDAKNKYGPVDEMSTHNISFSHKDGNPLLKDISFTLRKSDRLVIVGETGSGKSTLSSIITGLLDGYSGTINYYYKGDKVDYKPIISYLVQDGYLFDRNIRDNIFFLNPRLADEEYDKIMKVSLLDDVMRIHGDNHIGENGINLSGGERKRLRLARSLAKENADIMIFDELSSSLDNDTCEKIYNNIISSYGDRILIFIEHSENIISKFKGNNVLHIQKREG